MSHVRCLQRLCLPLLAVVVAGCTQASREELARVKPPGADQRPAEAPSAVAAPTGPGPVPDAAEPMAAGVVEDGVTASAAPPEVPAAESGKARTSYKRIGPAEENRFMGMLRLSIRITMPLGRSREEVVATMKRAALDLYKERRPGALMVFAHTPNDHFSGYWVGRAVYAPNGEWGDVGERAPMTFTIDLGRAYFEAPDLVPEFEVGEEVYIDGGFAGWVDLYGSCNDWTRASIVRRATDGAEARIEERRVSLLHSNLCSFIYRVTVEADGRKWTGWVWASQLKDKPDDGREQDPEGAAVGADAIGSEDDLTGPPAPPAASRGVQPAWLVEHRRQAVTGTGVRPAWLREHEPALPGAAAGQPKVVMPDLSAGSTVRVDARSGWLVDVYKTANDLSRDNLLRRLLDGTEVQIKRRHEVKAGSGTSPVIMYQVSVVINGRTWAGWIRESSIEGAGGEPEQVVMQNQPDPPPLREYTEPGGSVGDEGVLKTAKDESVFVCATRADFDALGEAVLANDRIGLSMLLASGSMWEAPAGTRCLILDTGFTWTKVRILEGDHAPRTGIVPVEHVYTRP